MFVTSPFFKTPSLQSAAAEAASALCLPVPSLPEITTTAAGLPFSRPVTLGRRNAVNRLSKNASCPMTVLPVASLASRNDCAGSCGGSSAPFAFGFFSAVSAFGASISGVPVRPSASSRRRISSMLRCASLVSLSRSLICRFRLLCMLAFVFSMLFKKSSASFAARLFVPLPTFSLPPENSASKMLSISFFT